MHLQQGKIICKETAITPVYEKKVMRNPFTGTFHAATILKNYPSKQLTNVKDFGPPSLCQQSLHILLRDCTCVAQTKDDNELLVTDEKKGRHDNSPKNQAANM